MIIINTKEDLNSLRGTPEYDKFVLSLKNSMFQKKDVQIYPENYNTPEYSGEKLEPIWQTFEDLSTITRFGFDKSEFSED